MKNPAAVAYEAFRTHMNAQGWHCYNLSWQYLSDEEKKAWWEVIRSLQKEGMKCGEESVEQSEIEKLGFKDYY